ncbi:hypothetical protein NL108_008611, partial [Boleophthalmus pectinirostris]
PFQPSDDMMLMFYSYYKQATLGPCNVARPTGFWDTRGKAKWDAWSALGNMTREEAMKNYVEDIQLILEAIPISTEVTDLVQKLGNFFTEVESNNEDAEENEIDKRHFTRPFANHTGIYLCHFSGFGDFWADIQNLPETENDGIVVDQSVNSEDSKSFRLNCEHKPSEDEANGAEDISDGEYKEEEEMEEREWDSDQMHLMVENKRWRSDFQGSNHSSMEPSVSSFTNGTHSSLNSEVEEEELAFSLDPAIQCNPYIYNGHLSDHNVPAVINVRSTDSDNEEFCDSMEHLAIDEVQAYYATTKVIIIMMPVFSVSTSNLQLHESRSLSKRHNDPRFNGFLALHSENQPGLTDGIRTSDFKSAMSRRGMETFGPTYGTQSGQNVSVACCCVSQSTQSMCNSRENMNEHIASALLRLHQDMENVLRKLHTLEVLQTSQVKYNDQRSMMFSSK